MYAVLSRLYGYDSRMSGYYNKEYREGFPRGFLLTAAVDCHQTRRVRRQFTAMVSDNPRGDPDGVSLFYLPFLSTYDAKICQNIP